MSRIFLKISRLERITLLFTALFVIGTLAYFLAEEPTEGLTFVETSATETTGSHAPSPEAPGMLAGEVLNVNTASAEELERLPGIGEKKAAAIVAWREENGAFSSVEMLLNVKGIGEGILKKITPYITVEINKEGKVNGENISGG